ncbi:uncharacterized protein LOC135835546 isoform X2 [Planococcus citri]|uniref:uncharacterized protein LOC135835546 isoform X2 n=1 Tax=Planococcus citri TaxID=170843 RepID=UPI0031F84438
MMDSYGEDLTLIVQRMGSLHLKWMELNKTCKMLQASLAKANSKNDVLQMKLTQSREETQKIKEDNKRLVVIVKKLERKLRTGSVHNLINVMKQAIHKYDEKVLPGVSELTKNVTDTDEEASIYSSDDESDSLSFSQSLDTNEVLSISSSDDESDSLPFSQCLAMHNYSKSLSYSTDNHPSKSTESYPDCVDVLRSVQDTRSEVIIASNNCSSETVSENTPVSESTLNPAPLVNNDQSNAGNIQDDDEAIIDTGCDSRISSSSVIISSTNVEKPKERLVSTQTPNPDQCISSTSSSQNNVSSTYDVLVQKSSIRLQSGFVVVCNIASLCVEEQNAEDNEPSSLLLNSSDGTFYNVNDESSSNHGIENIEIPDQENSDEKPNDTVLPVMVESTDSKDGYDSSSEIVELQPSGSETNQAQKLKRSCPSPSNSDESVPKRSTIHHSSPSANSSSFRPIKCYICEYENLDDSKTYATHILLDDHIIEKHPCTFPPYKRCLFNTDRGQCRRHFHPKQNYHKHVKRAHSNQDLHSKLKQRLIKCRDCTKVFLFESDFKDHRARFHNKISNKNKRNFSSFATLRNVSLKKSEVFVRPAAPQKMTSLEDLQQATSNEAADERRPTTPEPKVKGCALRILSPSTINSAISAVVKSLIPPSQ